MIDPKPERASPSVSDERERTQDEQVDALFEAQRSSEAQRPVWCSHGVAIDVDGCTSLRCVGLVAALIAAKHLAFAERPVDGLVRAPDRALCQVPPALRPNDAPSAIHASDGKGRAVCGAGRDNVSRRQATVTCSACIAQETVDRLARSA